jgi:transcription initiation factor TFIIIB Brf1 subunit/transcription initiation factor TFIIB
MLCTHRQSNVVSPEGSAGEKVCSNCGLVLDQTRSVRGYSHWNPEWYSNWSCEDSDTLKEWLTVLRTISCQLCIPAFPYREEAARTIRKGTGVLFQSQKFGKNKRETIAALIYIILREYDKVRPINDICKQLNLDTRLVSKQAWMLNKTIKNEQQIVETKRKSSRDYLFEQGGQITSNRSLLEKAEEILIEISKKGGNPISNAAGAFYLASKEKCIKFTKEEIAEAFKISPRTVDTNARRIRRLIKTMRPAKTNLLKLSHKS